MTIINSKMLDEIKMLGDNSSEFLQEIIEDYLADASKMIAEIQISIASKNHKEVFMLAHSLKSSSKQLGVEQVSLHAQTIESSAEKADYNSINQVFQLLCQDFEKAKDHLRSIS